MDLTCQFHRRRLGRRLESKLYRKSHSLYRKDAGMNLPVHSWLCTLQYLQRTLKKLLCRVLDHMKLMRS